jgi:hypothetical protein
VGSAVAANIASEEANSGSEKEFVPPTEPRPEEDIERLVPDPTKPFELTSGFWVETNRLRLREFLAMLKIVTRGAAMAMGSVRLNTDDEDFMQSMVSLFLFAIPEAEDEAVDFIRMMVKPVKPSGAVFANDDERVQYEQKLTEELDNPELEDMVTIIETVIRREGKDLRSLGKRLSGMLEVARKTGQI